MERTYYPAGAKLVKLDDGLVGVSFGFWGCHEHEWGIAGIARAFGVPRKNEAGFEALRITQLPNGLYTGRNPDENYIIYDPSALRGYYDDLKRGLDGKFQFSTRPWTQRERAQNISYWLDTKLLIDGEDYLEAAWDASSFALRARGDENRAALEALETAFLEEDVVIAYNTPLVQRLGLLIYSRIPEKLKADFREKFRTP